MKIYNTNYFRKPNTNKKKKKKNTGNDNAANVRILVKITASLNDFSEKFVAKSIQCLRAIQGDQADLSASFGQDIFICLAGAHR